jgi:transketolase
LNDLQTVNLLKGLVIDGVNSANSGHPGGAMSSMDFAYLLYTEFMNYDPTDADWKGRDRFVLSAGHESMLQYSLLHGIGWLEKSDLQSFRQLHSKTPGHPENFETKGVECTTGPLGQGAAMSLGFSIGELHLQETLDKNLFGNKVWTLMGDGCMQEEVTLGAASYAGHLGLNNLIWFYDRNRIQISGQIDRSTSDDEATIFKGFGWNVLEVKDGHNHEELRAAMTAAKNETSKPTLIIADTKMAKGAATLEGSAKTHGAPLAPDERAATKKGFEIPEGEEFYFPEEARAHFQRNFAAMTESAAAWKKTLDDKLSDSEFKKKYDGYFNTDLTNLSKINWEKDVATRAAYGTIIDTWAHEIPNLVGGSADLEPSNMTGAFAKKVADFSINNREGRNFAFGVREFPMSCISNGLALHGAFIPFDATFLSFADYSRPALRLGAIQKVRTIHEFTHDSFYLGEDGPTHQPIEHVMSLRLMPDMYVMRPACARETEVMMREAIKLDLPTSIMLTRQGLPLLKHSDEQLSNAAKGGWVVKDATDPDLVIYATGSEVSLALKSVELLEKNGTAKNIKVVSLPCWELFDQQPLEYRKSVLSPECKRKVSIEAGVTTGWEKYVGLEGLTIGVNRYGMSAPAKELEKFFGFTPEAVAEKVASHNFG